MLGVEIRTIYEQIKTMRNKLSTANDTTRWNHKNDYDKMINSCVLLMECTERLAIVWYRYAISRIGLSVYSIEFDYYCLLF